MTRLATVFIVLGTLALLAWILWQHFSLPEESVSKPAERPVRVDPRLVPPDALRAYRSAARDQGIDWKLLSAIGHAESDHGRSPLPGVRGGVNSAGCCAGPMQLCVTDSCGNVASLYARDGDRDGTYSVYDIYDASATAAAYIRWIENFVGDDPRLVAAAYNAGPTIVAEEGIPPYPETRAYVRRVQNTLAKLQGAS